jgi:hypothetical protein
MLWRLLVLTIGTRALAGAATKPGQRFAVLQ